MEALDHRDSAPCGPWHQRPRIDEGRINRLSRPMKSNTMDKIDTMDKVINVVHRRDYSLVAGQ